MQTIEADYVVIGAGSAGCVLANRLSADGRSRVILLEAGGDDRLLRNPAQVMSNAMIKIPAGYTRTAGDTRISWNYFTQPVDLLGGRRLHHPRGKVLGGSSALNGMLWVRGMREDYDDWRDAGCTGWGWDAVEPIFRRIEHFDQRQHEAGVDLVYAPIENRTFDSMLEAFKQYGLPVDMHLNEGSGERVGRVPMTARHGVRRSAATTYLHPAMNRPNLTVLTGVMVKRIRCENGVAVAVECLRGGQPLTVSAGREIVLSAGAINSPKLLELSGIGQGERLKAAGIDVVVDSARVGENLQDHFTTALSARLKRGHPCLNSMSTGIGLAGQVLKFAFLRSGLLTAGASGYCAFLKSSPEQERIDLQFFFRPASVDVEESVRRGQITLEKEPGVTLAFYEVRPRSLGHVHIASADFDAAPEIVPNYLADSHDQQVIVDGLLRSREVLAQPAIAGLLEHEVLPGKAVDSRDDLLAYAKASGASSHHQCGTCAMGASDKDVVNPALQVNGVRNLRVADASVMPRIVSGNTNAACIMIGERAAEMILAARA